MFVNNTIGWKQTDTVKQKQARFPTPAPAELDCQLS